METHWSELQAHGMEVEEGELSQDEFANLFPDGIKDTVEDD